MKRDENTPVRLRTIMEDAYEAAGFPDNRFSIPQPFTADHFAAVVEVGASPVGLANQANQLICENLANNMAAKVRAAIKNGTPLPTQEDMDALYDAYDFSGVRASTGGVTTSLLDRLFARLAGQFIRRLIKKKGYQDQPAPVTVAKRDEAPAAGQISFEDFEAEVSRLVNGEGPWGEVEAFVDVRADLYEEARNEEAAIRARQASAESKLSTLGL
jgi:hypothetical protein